MAAKNERQLSKLFNKTAISARFLVFLTMFGFLKVAPTYAQSRAAGEIRGTVTDTTGAVIPGVAVTIQNTLTGVITNLTSDSTGVYDAASLDPGNYTVSFAKQGFKKEIKSNNVLHVEAITVNAALQVGAVSQQVEVKAGAILVQTETSDKRQTLTSDAVVELPSVGRNWFDFFGLLPGVNAGQGQYAGGGAGPLGSEVGFNGQGGYQMLGLMDGGTATMLPAQNYSNVPIQAIGEISFNVSNFDAEYSNGLAVFNVIQKSGTNHFHGEGFEFNQNDEFEARDFFSPTTAPLRWNMFGGAVGGPIKRDKLFFFFSFQDNPINSWSPGLATYPTAAMRAGDLSGLPQAYDPAGLVLSANGTYSNNTPFVGNQIPASRIDPAAAAINSYYPMPNLPGFYNNYDYTIASPSSTKTYNWKINYNISSGNRLNVSQMFIDYFAPAQGAPTCPIDCMSSGTHQQTDVISDVWSITPNIVNEYRQSLQRSYQPYIDQDLGMGWSSKLGIPNLTADTFPEISISGSGAPAGIGTAFVHALLGYTTVTEGDTLTLVKGKHILKFGGEYNNSRDNLAWGDIFAGQFSFSGQFTENPQNPSATGEGYADFLLGLPGSWSDGWTPPTGNRTGTAQAFAQDDLKMTPKLTLNLGLRWLAQRGYSEQFNRCGTMDPTLLNPATNTLGAMWYCGQNGRHAMEATIWDNFQPRVGFAWAPKENWSVRASYGIFDNMWGGDTFQQGIGTGIAVSGYDYSPNSLIPFMQLHNGHAPPAIPTWPPSSTYYNGSGTFYEPYYIPMPYIQQWHLSVQHQFKGDTMLEVGYIGARGVHLSDPNSIDMVSPANVAKYGAIGVNMVPYTPYPQYPGGVVYYAFGGWDDYNSLQLTVKKTLSHGLWLISNYTWSHSLDTNTQNGWGGAESDFQIALDPAASYGNSQIDARQVWNGGFIYQLPVGQGRAFLNRRGVLNGVVGGWQLSNTWQASDGQPFTPTWGGPNYSFGMASTWMPNRVCNGSVSNPTIQLWFNPACFTAATPGTYGNSGRDILSMPGFFNMNTSLSKNFKLPHLGEQAKLQIRIDASNVLNHPNFGPPNASVTPAPTAAGLISSDIAERGVQLGARVVF
jgi:hypothetical protein